MIRFPLLPGLLCVLIMIVGGARLCAESALPIPRIDTPAPYQKGPFVHPGGLHTQSDLDRMKAKVAAKETPWIEGWEQLIRDPAAQLEYRSHARANLGDSRQQASADAHAAYLNFLRGYISGMTATSIMPSRSATIGPRR
ncbi:MAG: hypothetical protein QM755_04795 [Luteolibacter sp.]